MGRYIHVVSTKKNLHHGYITPSKRMFCLVYVSGVSLCSLMLLDAWIDDRVIFSHTLDLYIAGKNGMRFTLFPWYCTLLGLVYSLEHNASRSGSWILYQYHLMEIQAPSFTPTHDSAFFRSNAISQLTTTLPNLLLLHLLPSSPPLPILNNQQCKQRLNPRHIKSLLSGKPHSIP